MNPKTDPLAKTLFILGDFPQPTQTFIQREMVEMKKRGATVNVMADTRVESSHLHPLLQEIEQNALFADTPWKWITRSLLKGVVRAPRFARDLTWALGLPHRTRYNRARFVISLLTAMDLAPQIVDKGVTYLHAHFAAYQTETAMCLSRITGIPYGATWHAYGIWQDANILREKISGARTILTCTEYNAFHLRELAGADADKIHLVRHGLDLSDIPVFPPKAAPETPTLLAIGRLTPKKGFNHLIEAAALLRDRALQFKIEIAGDGPEQDRLQEKIHTLQLDDAVTLLGAISNDRVWAKLASAVGLVAPSIRDKDGNIDGIPNVLLEAMAMSRPVIGTRLSGIPEVVREGETGLLVPPGDSASLANAMEKLIVDKESSTMFGQNGRTLVEKEYDVRRNIDEQIALLSAAQKPDNDQNGVH
ncbi:MAG: glycosyltransferase family 4 protein [Proteobacteria bacterium]|nr:glycosyltransferase family 4 protein [Pseudomonadota bacterium]